MGLVPSIWFVSKPNVPPCPRLPARRSKLQKKTRQKRVSPMIPNERIFSTTGNPQEKLHRTSSVLGFLSYSSVVSFRFLSFFLCQRQEIIMTSDCLSTLRVDLTTTMVSKKTPSAYTLFTRDACDRAVPRKEVKKKQRTRVPTTLAASLGGPRQHRVSKRRFYRRT